MALRSATTLLVIRTSGGVVKYRGKGWKEKRLTGMGTWTVDLWPEQNLQDFFLPGSFHGHYALRQRIFGA